MRRRSWVDLHHVKRKKAAIVAERLNGYVGSDLVPILKTISDRLSCRRDAQRDSADGLLRNPRTTEACGTTTRFRAGASRAAGGGPFDRSPARLLMDSD